MFTKRSLMVAAAVAVMALAATGSVRAQQAAPRLGSEVIDVVGKAVITCVRPSTLVAEQGFEPRVTRHRFDYPRSNRVDLTIEMRWHGALSQSPYDSRFTIKVFADARGIEVLGIDYTDNCLFPAPDVRLLNSVIRLVNDELSRAWR